MKNARGSKSARTTPKATLVEVRCAHEGCIETTMMPFTRAAKGTHRCPEHASGTPTPPAQGGPPEVALDNGTVAVLPNPVDAPPPRKPAARKRKPEPTVATKAAPGRDTPAEVAVVPEAAPAVDLAAEASTAKKSRATKPVTPKTAPVAAAGSLRAIGAAWIESLRAAGHSVSTVSSYTNDLEVAHEFFGDVKAAEITEKQIAAFNTSKGVMKKANGKAKAMPTILKTRRALRLALTWAEQKRLIKAAPYAVKAPA